MTRFKFFPLLSFILLTCTTLLISCDGSKKQSPKENINPEEDVRSYGKYFVEKLNANQLDSLKASYPDIAKADSLVPVKSDTIMVVETAPGQYDMTLAEGISLKVTRSDDGNISVTESKGLFAFPTDKVDIAKKTGMWDDNLSDAQLNERMNDVDFFKHIDNKTRVSTKNILSVSKPHYGEIIGEDSGYTEGYQTITNNSDLDISGKDYSIIKHVYKMADWRGDDEYDKNITEKGKDIPAHGSIKIEIGITYTSSAEVKGVKWNVSDKELSNRLVKFTGNEYQDYLNSKK